MSAEQSLVGALGLASWRCRDRLLDHAEVAPAGRTVRGRSSPIVGGVDVLGLNEVGVTDLVMATIWRHGPHASAYAVSPGAEANHLGADIAILHAASKRLLLYQAKLARHDAGKFRLKSSVTRSQLRLLNRRSVTLQGVRHRVTGRLALYQTDVAPFIDRCGRSADPDIWWWPRWWGPWRMHGLAGDAHGDRRIARRYYEEALVLSGCSSSGVLAAAAPPADQPITQVAERATWPWEFDAFTWLTPGSPLDRDDDGDERSPFNRSTPEFDPYRPIVGEPIAAEVASEMAQELVQRLRLPAGQRLYLVVLT